jgi:hypothetical protein
VVPHGGSVDLETADPPGQREQRFGLEPGDVLADALVDAHAEPHVTEACEVTIQHSAAGRGGDERQRGAVVAGWVAGRAGVAQRGVHGSGSSSLDGEEVLFIERLTARDAVISYTRIAGRLPLHISSSGHILLAYGPPDLQQRILSRPLVRYTPNTITTPEALRAALAETRRAGRPPRLPGHVREDATGVAVPVRNALNDVVAALSVIVPNDGRAQAHVPVLLAAARGLSRSLATPRPRV